MREGGGRGGGEVRLLIFLKVRVGEMGEVKGKGKAVVGVRLGSLGFRLEIVCRLVAYILIRP